MTRQNHKRGFNLIEAAIVLGVVGLVIGGIWVAAASVTASMRVNATTAEILQITESSRKLFTYAEYPSTDGVKTNVTDVAIAAGIVPSDFVTIPPSYRGTLAESPSKAVFGVFLNCDFYGCPALLVRVYGAYDMPTTITPADCAQIVMRIAGAAKASGLKLIRIARIGNTAHIMLEPPFDVTNLVCPLQLLDINFYFDP